MDRLLRDNSRARQWTGWTQEVPLEDGLRRTAQWVEANLDLDAYLVEEPDVLGAGHRHG